MSITKFLFTVGIAVVFCLGALSCTKDSTGTGPTPGGGTDAQAVASDKSALAITYSAGDSAGWVTSNIVLPASGSNGSSISWVPSASSRITTEGVVSRPAAESGDALVTLTATISKGMASDVKAFTVTVKAGTGGNFTPGTVTDIDGNVYTTVKIGTQEWTVENLRVTKYNDGTVIPLVTDSAAWARVYYDSLTTPAYCFYQNTTNADSIKKYGALYNWYVVNTKKLAPAGWHVPSDAEWTIMEKYLVKNGYNWDGTTDTTVNDKIAKALAAKTSWSSSTTTGDVGCDLTLNNRSGFSALGGGCRDGYGGFSSQSNLGFWWSASEYAASGAWSRYLYYGLGSLYRSSDYKSCGFSVRLLRDN